MRRWARQWRLHPRVGLTSLEETGRAWGCGEEMVTAAKRPSWMDRQMDGGLWGVGSTWVGSPSPWLPVPWHSQLPP